MRRIVPRSAASSRARRASRGSGAAIMPARVPATPGLPRMCRGPVRSCTRTHGRAIGAAMQSMPPSATVCTSGHAMTMERGDAKSTAIVVKERVRRCGRLCVPSAASISRTCLSRSRGMKPGQYQTRHTPVDPTDVHPEPLSAPWLYMRLTFFFDLSASGCCAPLTETSWNVCNRHVNNRFNSSLCVVGAW